MKKHLKAPFHTTTTESVTAVTLSPRGLTRYCVICGGDIPNTSGRAVYCRECKEDARRYEYALRYKARRSIRRSVSPRGKVFFVGHAPGIHPQNEADCLGLLDLWMWENDFKEALSVPGFLPAGLVIETNGNRAVVYEGQIISEEEFKQEEFAKCTVSR